MLLRCRWRAIWPPSGPLALPGVIHAIAAGWGQPSISQLVRVAADCIILNIALVLAFVLHFLWTMIDEQGQHGQLNQKALAEVYVSHYLSAAWIVTLIIVGVFCLNGMYTSTRGYPIRLKATLVAEAVTFAFVIVGMAAFVIRDAIQLPRSVLILAWIIALALFVASRLWSAIWRNIVQNEAKPPDTPGEARSYANGGPRVSEATREKAVLVIGGAGYIGSALLPRLLAEGYRVRVLDLMLYGTGPIAPVLDHPKLDTIRADFRRVDTLVAAMQGVDHVVHLGGIVGDPACAIDEELTVDVNLAATRLIGEVAKGNGIKHFVFASTCSVYGASEEVLAECSAVRPLSLYARSKMASEQVLLGMANDRFTPIIVRFGTIYGLSGRTRFDLVVNLLAAKAVFDGRISIFGGDQWRPFLHVDDAALAVAQLLCLPPGRGAEVFNVGSDAENYTIAQVGEIVKRIVPEAQFIVQPADQDRRNYKVSFSKIRLMVGFKPHWTVEDGVRQVVNAIRAGEISDYRETQYSNERYLNEMNGSGLDRPQIQWAYDLLRETCPPTNAKPPGGAVPAFSGAATPSWNIGELDRPPASWGRLLVQRTPSESAVKKDETS
jgi:nucleoside-diphosphate-sugar epimerase